MAEGLNWSRSGGCPRRRSRRFLLGLLVGWGFLPALAQEQPEVDVRIDFVAWGDAIGGLTLDAKKAEGEIKARSFQYSEPVRYRGPRVLKLHQTGSSEAEEAPLPMTDEDREHESIPLPEAEIRKGAKGLPAVPPALLALREEEPTLVSLIALPQGARRVTVLLAPAAEGTYQGYVIDDDPTKLPVGRLRVHNLSPHPILMTLNGRKTEPMKPRAKTMIAAPAGHVIYQLAYQKEGEWIVQENNILPVQPDEQTQLIVLKSTNQFFQSSDGASGGYLQMVTLTRSAD